MSDWLTPEERRLPLDEQKRLFEERARAELERIMREEGDS